MDRIEKYTELQKKHQEKMKENRLKEKERKARTHRLIIRGAIAEALIDDAEQMTDNEFQEALTSRLKRYKELENEIADSLS